MKRTVSIPGALVSRLANWARDHWKRAWRSDLWLLVLLALALLSLGVFFSYAFSFVRSITLIVT